MKVNVVSKLKNLNKMKKYIYIFCLIVFTAFMFIGCDGTSSDSDETIQEETTLVQEEIKIPNIKVSNSQLKIYINYHYEKDMKYMVIGDGCDYMEVINLTKDSLECAYYKTH